MEMGWSPFPGSPTAEISNSQSSASCRLPLSDPSCCRTTKHKTPAGRSLVEDQEKGTGQDMAQRVLEGFDPCFHATAGNPILWAHAVPATTATLVLPPSSSEMETSRWSRELAKARHKNLVRLGQPPASRARHAQNDRHITCSR